MNVKIVLCMLAVGAIVVQANLSEVSYYCTSPIQTPPVLDGKLEDPCWKNASVYTDSFEYFKADPGRGKLRNSFQIVYDQQGLYVAIVNYDQNIKKLRQMAIARDDVNLWKDDCAEIYIDNQVNGAGFRKFTVNSKGVLGDMLQVDSNVKLEQWDGMGWQAKTKVYSDRWTIEAFFPWGDLGKKPQPGDVWRFCHVRYAWSSGKFVGTTSSPGGNYQCIGNFGYLYFMQEKEQPNIKALADVFKKHVSPPWGVVIGKTLVLHDGDGVKCTRLEDMIASEKNKAMIKLQKMEKHHEKFDQSFRRLEKKVADAENLPEQKSFLQFRIYNQLVDKLDNLLWQIKLEEEFY